MSVGAFENEPTDMYDGWCATHERYDPHTNGCPDCKDEALNRAIAMKKGE